jgi:hypothetical protein
VEKSTGKRLSKMALIANRASLSVVFISSRRESKRRASGRPVCGDGGIVILVVAIAEIGQCAVDATEGRSQGSIRLPTLQHDIIPKHAQKRSQGSVSGDDDSAIMNTGNLKQSQKSHVRRVKMVSAHRLADRQRERQRH